MLISHRRRFIYTKTKKTAGTSVEAYFEPYCMAEGEWTECHARDEYASEAGIIGYRGPALPDDYSWWNHMPAVQIRDRIGEETWSRYFKFCVIRNPFEKAISAFYFFKKNGSFSSADASDEREEFEAFLESGGLPIDRETYLIDGVFCLDDVVRHENLQADLERICARVDVPWNPFAVPSFKVGIRPRIATPANLYTERSKQLIEGAYAFELDYFGYSFPGERGGADMPARMKSKRAA